MGSLPYCQLGDAGEVFALMFALAQTVGSHFPAKISVQPGEADTEEGMRNSTILIAAVLLGGAISAHAAFYHYEVSPASSSSADDRSNSADFATSCGGQAEEVVKV
jgi:hypothetical protein